MRSRLTFDAPAVVPLESVCRARATALLFLNLLNIWNDAILLIYSGRVEPGFPSPTPSTKPSISAQGDQPGRTTGAHAPRVGRACTGKRSLLRGHQPQGLD